MVPESILSRIVHNYEMLDAIRQRKNIDFTVETLRDDLNISRTTADKCIAVLKDEKDEKTFQTKTVEYPLITKHEKRTVILNDAANIDFYSGFVYHMLGLPVELFTPVFAMARIAGWSAHLIEEHINAGKIIRPAYKTVGGHRNYIPMDQRE